MAHSKNASTLPLAVTFDCWQTLLVETDPSRPRAARTDALIACVRATGRSLSTDGAEDVLRRAWRRHDQNWQTGKQAGAREMAQWSLEAIGVSETELDRNVASLTADFGEASLLGEVRAIEGSKNALQRLQRAGIRTGLVCDTGFSPGRVVRQLLDRVGLFEHLEALAFSDEVGVPKPDPKIFEHVLEKLGVEAERALHIGDLRRTDVAGARALGMKTARLCVPNDDRSQHPEADRVVRSHLELLDWLALPKPV